MGWRLLTTVWRLGFSYPTACTAPTCCPKHRVLHRTSAASRLQGTQMQQEEKWTHALKCRTAGSAHTMRRMTAVHAKLPWCAQNACNAVGAWSHRRRCHPCYQHCTLALLQAASCSLIPVARAVSMVLHHTIPHRIPCWLLEMFPCRKESKVLHSHIPCLQHHKRHHKYTNAQNEPPKP